MDSTREASTTVDLDAFLQRHGSRLPCTVKVIEGFCGTNATDTLEGDQILVIYKIERENTIIALDPLNQEICVPRNMKNKVQLLPFEHHREHKIVRHLFNAHQTQYFRVLEDLASFKISSETTLQLLSDEPFQNFAKCKVVDLYDSREVLLPLEQQGRFQPLLDPREYYLEEVLAQYQLPVNIRFVPPSRANDSASLTHPLSSLENIHLEYETEVDMIFAASVDDPLSLNLFPRTLDINVSFGFKVTADTSKKITECRQILAGSKRILKRLDIIASNSFYFKVCPVRRFNFESLQPPSLSIPKVTNERKAELLSKAKQNETAKQTAKIREPLTLPCPQSAASKPGWFSEEHATDYENCETGETCTNSLGTEARKAEDEVTAAVPALPPKLSAGTSRSATPKDTTRANEQNRPVPKPRKRLNPAIKKNQENVNSGVSQAQPQDKHPPELTDSFSGDDTEDTCPELPPRPEFLKIRSIGDNKDDGVSREERPPPLPPRCPGPNQSGFPAYLVVDVTDWRAVEEKALRPNTIMDEGLYSDAKDDGQVFKQDRVSHLDLSLMYPPDEMKSYIDMESPEVKQRPYVDMERNGKTEMDGGRGGRENSHKNDLTQPDERGASGELENPQLRKAGRKNGPEETKRLEEESSDEDCPYEEIEEQHESSQRRNESKENSVNEEKANVERPSKIPRSKTTQGSFDTRPSRAAIVTCPMNQGDIIISGHRDEDWMDFTDIEQYLKLRKQLREALAEKADLERRLSETGDTPTAESQTQKPPTSDHIVNAPPHMGKADSLDENYNHLNSSEEACNHSHRGSHAETRSESVPYREGDYSPSLSSLEAEDSKNKKASLSSPAPEKVVLVMRITI